MDLHDHLVERQLIRALADSSRSDMPTAAVALADREQVRADDMHHPAHAEVLRAVLQLSKQGRSTDYASVRGLVAEVPAVKNAGGNDWLLGLLFHASDAWEPSIPHYAGMVRDLALRRRVFAAGLDMQKRAVDRAADAGAVLGEATRAISALTRGVSTLRTVQQHLDDALGEMDEIQRAERIPILKTGIDHLDAVIGGLQPAVVTIIGAMPGVGKSALVATICQNVAKAGKRIGVFSLEDEGRWLAWRLLAHESRIPQFVLCFKHKSPFQMERIGEGAARLWNYADKILVDDRPALRPRDVVQSARDMLVNHGVEAIWVDHLGELRYDGPRKERHDLDVEEGLGELRDIAKTHKIPVVCCVHLKRRNGLGPDTEPELTDFANASAIERKARVALGLSRAPGSDSLKVTVLKQTKGKAGVSIDLRFDGLSSMVRDAEGEVRDQYTTQEEAR